MTSKMPCRVSNTHTGRADRASIIIVVNNWSAEWITPIMAANRCRLLNGGKNIKNPFVCIAARWLFILVFVVSFRRMANVQLQFVRNFYFWQNISGGQNNTKQKSSCNSEARNGYLNEPMESSHRFSSFGWIMAFQIGSVFRRKCNNCLEVESTYEIRPADSWKLGADFPAPTGRGFSAKMNKPI